MPEGLRITALQSLCLHDGPGVRTTVFLRGCFLDCPWCCNPETKTGARDYFHRVERCVGGRSLLCGECRGESFVADCPWGVFEGTTQEVGVEALYGRLMSGREFWGAGGGVTFSGGEPLMQAHELVPLMERLKREGVHMVVETSAFAPEGLLDAVLPLVDGFIVDIKMVGRPVVHGDYRGVDLRFDENLTRIVSAGKLHMFRMVLIRGVTATRENIGALVALMERHGVDAVELLQYHSLGRSKYEQLGVAAPGFECVTAQEGENICHMLSKKQIKPILLNITL